MHTYHYHLTDIVQHMQQKVSLEQKMDVEITINNFARNDCGQVGKPGYEQEYINMLIYSWYQAMGGSAYNAKLEKIKITKSSYKYEHGSLWL